MTSLREDYDLPERPPLPMRQAVVMFALPLLALGLWLALLLNHHLPFKAVLRAIVLLPFIVPTALSAIAFWWMYDSQFSVLSWALTKMGLIDQYIDFLGDPWNARLSTIAANVWRGVPFVAISLLAGLQREALKLL